VLRIGFHLEGPQDDETLRILLARLLGIERSAIEPLVFSSRVDGYEGVVQFLGAALAEFEQEGVRAAVVGVDNDGTPMPGLDGTVVEDPRRPRHRPGHQPGLHVSCRYCRLAAAVERARTTFEEKGSDWPVVIAVPVEALESWLLWGADCVGRGRHPRPEDLPVGELKTKLYGRKHATQHDFRVVGRPIAEQMDLDGLRRDVPSFALFADAVEHHRDRLLAEPHSQP